MSDPPKSQAWFDARPRDRRNPTAGCVRVGRAVTAARAKDRRKVHLRRAVHPSPNVGRDLVPPERRPRAVVAARGETAAAVEPEIPTSISPSRTFDQPAGGVGRVRLNEISESSGNAEQLPALHPRPSARGAHLRVKAPEIIRAPGAGGVGAAESAEEPETALHIRPCMCEMARAGLVRGRRDKRCPVDPGLIEELRSPHPCPVFLRNVILPEVVHERPSGAAHGLQFTTEKPQISKRIGPTHRARAVRRDVERVWLPQRPILAGPVPLIRAVDPRPMSTGWIEHPQIVQSRLVAGTRITAAAKKPEPPLRIGPAHCPMTRPRLIPRVRLSFRAVAPESKRNARTLHPRPFAGRDVVFPQVRQWA